MRLPRRESEAAHCDLTPGADASAHSGWGRLRRCSDSPEPLEGKPRSLEKGELYAERKLFSKAETNEMKARQANDQAPICFTSGDGTRSDFTVTDSAPNAFGGREGAKQREVRELKEWRWKAKRAPGTKASLRGEYGREWDWKAHFHPPLLSSA